MHQPGVAHDPQIDELLIVERRFDAAAGAGCFRAGCNPIRTILSE